MYKKVLVPLDDSDCTISCLNHFNVSLHMLRIYRILRPQKPFHIFCCFLLLIQSLVIHRLIYTYYFFHMLAEYLQIDPYDRRHYANEDRFWGVRGVVTDDPPCSIQFDKGHRRDVTSSSFKFY
jgi:hypothetical protein